MLKTEQPQFNQTEAISYIVDDKDGNSYTSAGYKMSGDKRELHINITHRHQQVIIPIR